MLSVTVRRVCTAVLLVSFLASGALASDPARYFPEDTALFIGWTKLMDADSESMARQQRWLKAMSADAAEDMGTDADFALLNALLDALEPLQTGTVGVGLLDFAVERKDPVVHAAAVITDVAKPQQLADTMQRLAEAGDPEALTARTVGGVDFQVSPLGDSGQELLWGVHDGAFILTINEVAAQRMVRLMAGDGPTLADNAELKFCRERIEADSDAGHFGVFVNFDRIRTRGKELATEMLGELPPEVDTTLDELGLTALHSKYAQFTPDEHGVTIKVFAHADAPHKGILKFWDQAPLTDADLRIVPRDAYWAEVVNCDLAGLWDETLRVVEAIDPDAVPMMQAPLMMATQMLGFSITEDFLPALGDTWAVFDAPDHGGLLMSGTVIAVDVNDAEALQGMLGQIVQISGMFASQSGATVQVKTTKHGKHEIHYVLFGGVPSPVAPAWGFVDDRCVFGLFPQSVAVAMQQVDPQTRGKSLLDHPRVAEVRKQLPKEIQDLHYLNSKYIARMLYPIGNMLQTMGVSQYGDRGLEIDLDVMPPIAEETAKVQDYVGGYSQREDGVLYIGSGDATPLAAVSAVALATSIMLPSLSRARTQAKRAVTGVNLRSISQACIIYAVDHNEELPPSLDALVAEGMLTEDKLISPRDGETRYVLLPAEIRMSAIRRPDRYILAYEPPIEGDEGHVNAAFADGHVEYMERGAFEERLRETYQEMGKEDEVPAEFR
jgi:prepilin-type processing-associated H-X9-DG protein